MATRKSALKKSPIVRKAMMDDMHSMPLVNETSPSMPSAPKFNTKILYVVVALLALSALLLANKGLLVAAVVDGKPIFRWDLTRVLTSRFGNQTLEGMITEHLIASEARKTGVSVTEGELGARKAEILKSVGGSMSLEDVLKVQGISKEEFESQLRLQLTVQKILGQGVEITDKDIDQFIATNKAALAATEPAALRAEARQAILESKVSEKLQPWFAELKKRAKILRFL